MKRGRSSVLGIVVVVAIMVACGMAPFPGRVAAAPSASPTAAAGRGAAHSHPTVQRGPTGGARAVTRQAQSLASPSPTTAWAPVGPSPTTGNQANVGTSQPGSYGDTSGRITALVAYPSSSVVWAGAADGGIWKSTDSGNTWTAQSDNAPTLAIGSLAVDGTGMILYAGTGEENYAQDSQPGQGILKSTDGGVNWLLMGQATLTGLHIGSVAIDGSISNAQHVFAATDKGLYESNDGGSTWALNGAFAALITHFNTATNGVFEIHADPSVPGRFYLSVGDACDSEYGQVLVTTNAGSTWSVSDTGSLGNRYARIGIGVGPNNTAYAAWSDCLGDLVSIRKTTNGGASWATVMTQGGANYKNYFDLGNPQGWYDNVVAVDPTNANRAVFGGVTVLNTTDGGSTYSDVGHVYDGQAVLHPDFHAAAFTGASTLYIGNDGGVYHTTTLGGTSSSPSWTDVNRNLQITQFYGGSALNVSTLLGGTQDNGDPGRLPTSPPAPAWQQYGIGDGTGTAIIPGSSGNSFYFSTPQGGIFQQVSTLVGGFESNPTYAGPCNVASDAACKDPAAFVAPFVMDPTSPQRLITVTNHVYQSTTGGLPAGAGGWTKMESTDLTSGTSNIFGQQDTLSALAQVPGTNTIVTGSSLSNNVYRTTDGSTYTKITGNLPAPTGSSFSFQGSTGWITSILINPANTAELWVTIGDSAGVGTVWHTTSAGTTNTWSDLTSGGTAPITGAVNSIVQDPATPTTLYVGTALGVYTCTGCGGPGSLSPVWSVTGSGGPPAVSVDGLTVTNDNTTLVAWTHGRSAWELPLSGSGTPVVNLQPVSVSFPGTTAGTLGSTQAVTLSNWGDASLNLTLSLGGANPGDFTLQTPNACPGSAIAPDTSCTVSVTFAPVEAGNLHAALVLTDDAAGSPQSVPLSGTASPPPLHVSSTQQYVMNGSDGATWQVMDATNLSMTFTPATNSTAVMVGNADLWTWNAGFNQDIGIQVTPQGGAPALAAWKESGGFAGTFSPNAAAVQGQYPMTAGTTYTVRLVWKTNTSMPAGNKVSAGAGPYPSGSTTYSPTTLSAFLYPAGGSTFQQSTSTAQYVLNGSDGATWQATDSSAQKLPSWSVTPATDSQAMLTGNADLWTWNASYNQDIGIQVTPACAGQPSSLAAWKESGGFAGTFSPNAAFVQTLCQMTGGTQYTVQLVWKTNKLMPSGNQISAGAGPLNGVFSPTTLFGVVEPTTSAQLTTKASTQQYTTTSDGSSWQPVDSSQLSEQVTVPSSCEARITANADLWTWNATYNQDIGIRVNGVVAAWKESGGFAGTFSPNAAFVQAVQPMSQGTVYTIEVVWKSNVSMPTGTHISAGAGPWPANTQSFSPTTLAVDLHC